MDIRKNLLWNTVGSIFYSMCQWVITIIVVYVASYEDAGYLSLAMTMSSSFSAISLFSMRNFQVSDVRGEFATTQYVSSRIWTCGIAFTVCAFCAVFGNSTYQMLCIDAFMFLRVAEAMADVLHGVNQKHDRYNLIGISYILRGIITVGVFSFGLLLVDNLWLILFLMAGMNFLVVVCFDWKQTGKLEAIKINLKEREIVELLKKCVPLVIFSFLLSLENLIPKDVLKLCYDTETLGIYSTIASPVLVVQLFASVVFSPFLPKFSQIYNDGKIDVFRKLLHKVYMFLGIFGVVVSVGAMLLGRWGLRLLLGESILDYYYLFMPIVFTALLTGIVWIISAIVILLRKIKALLIAILADFVICVIITYPIISGFGANGVSIVQIISLSILALFLIAICEREARR
ncbi:MAG: lipopolysaccharide biosynthesis protein [Lachnospiraceae bacterium]|nr:lipopolysaccharide biosynthesis protein [Lachnospiraceae bacterium]